MQFPLSVLSEWYIGCGSRRTAGLQSGGTFDFFEKRKGILDGVCISGGEPTLSDGLEEFLGKIKELGYAVKLDTNGSRPKIVKHLAEAGLIDKVAMDIKACPDNYGNLTGIEKPDMDSIFETADFLLHGNLDYEFRTTVVRGTAYAEGF